MIALLAETADVRKLRKTRFIKDGALDVESLLRRSELTYLYLKTRYAGESEMRDQRDTEPIHGRLCRRFMLSPKDVKAFQCFGEQCHHEHTSSGHEMLGEREHLFHDLQQICKSIKDKSVKKAIKGRIALLNYNYDVYMATVMQSAQQRQEIEELSGIIGTSGVQIITDYMMKFEALMPRETSQDWYVYFFSYPTLPHNI